jgi:hypothetical protein
MDDLCEHETFRSICGICHRDNIITRLRAEVERVGRDYNTVRDAHDDWVRESERLTARVRELEGLASSYLQAAKQVGGCGDGNCVVLRPTGMHTNGGCRCTHDMDRARVLGVARLLGMAQHIARSLLPSVSGEKKGGK